MVPQNEGSPVVDENEHTAPDETVEDSKEVKEIKEKQAAIDAQTNLINSTKNLADAQMNLLKAQLGQPAGGDQAAQPAEPSAGQPAAEAGAAEAVHYATLVSYEALIKNADAIAAGINENAELKKLGNKARIAIVDSLALALDDVGTIQIKAQIEEFERLFTGHLQECQKILEPTKTVVLPIGRAAGAAAEAIKDLSRSDIDILTEKLCYRSTPGWANGLGLALGGAAAAASPVGLAITGITSLLSSASSIMGYFREDYSLQKVKPDVDVEALQAEVAGRLTSNKVILSKFFRIGSSKLLAALQKCLDLRGKLEDVKAKLQLDSAKEADAQLEEIEKPLRDLAVSSAATMISTFDTFFQKITTIAQENNNSSPLMVAVIRDYLDELEVTHYLYLKSVSIGGDVIKVNSIWPWRSAQMAVIAGSICSAVLVDKGGSVLYAKTNTPTLLKKRFDCRKFTTG